MPPEPSGANENGDSRTNRASRRRPAAAPCAGDGATRDPPRYWPEPSSSHSAIGGEPCPRQRDARAPPSSESPRSSRTPAPPRPGSTSSPRPPRCARCRCRTAASRMPPTHAEAAAARRARSAPTVRRSRRCFPHDAEYLAALDVDFARWADAGFGVPDFLDSLVAFQPQQHRVDGLRHLVRLPDVHAERQHRPARRGGAHRGDLAGVRRRARGRRVLERAVRADPLPRLHRGLRHQLGRALPGDRGDARDPDVHLGRDLRRPRGRTVPPGRARGIRDHQARPARRCRAPARRPGARRGDLRDVGPHPRPHPHARRPAVRPVHDQAAHAVLPLLARGAALRPDRVPRGRASWSRARRHRCDVTREHAQLVQYAILFDRIFRFAITGTRVRNYDGLGGQLLFAWLHQHHVLHWTDTQLDHRLGRRARRRRRPVGRDQRPLLALDRPPEGRALARRLRPRRGDARRRTRRRSGRRATCRSTAPPRGLTDAVLDDEFPLSMFYEALSKKMADVIESTSGITGRRSVSTLPRAKATMVAAASSVAGASSDSGRAVCVRADGCRSSASLAVGTDSAPVSPRPRGVPVRVRPLQSERAPRVWPRASTPNTARSTASCTSWAAGARVVPTTTGPGWSRGIVETVRNVSRAFYDDLRASAAGRLVMVSSSAVEAPTWANANYAAAKAAAEAWAQSAASGFAKGGGAAAVTLVVKCDRWRRDGATSTDVLAARICAALGGAPQRTSTALACSSGNLKRLAGDPTSRPRPGAASPATTTPACTPRCSRRSPTPTAGTRSPTARTSTPRACRRSCASTSASTAEAFPVFNGTGANVTALTSVLPRWGAVVATSTAHIHTDESGAPERISGLKLLTVADPRRQAHPRADRRGGLGLGRRAPGAAARRQHHADHRARHALHGRRGPRDRRLRARARHGRCTWTARASRTRPPPSACRFRDFTTDAGVDVLSFGGTKNGLLYGEAVVVLNPDGRRTG